MMNEKLLLKLNIVCIKMKKDDEWKTAFKTKYSLYE